MASFHSLSRRASSIVATAYPQPSRLHLLPTGSLLLLIASYLLSRRRPARRNTLQTRRGPSPFLAGMPGSRLARAYLQLFIQSYDEILGSVRREDEVVDDSVRPSNSYFGRTLLSFGSRSGYGNPFFSI
jgi:hypothetical protein